MRCRTKVSDALSVRTIATQGPGSNMISTPGRDSLSDAIAAAVTSLVSMIEIRCNPAKLCS
jgi:hypothetical protein